MSWNQITWLYIWAGKYVKSAKMERFPAVSYVNIYPVDLA